MGGIEAVVDDPACGGGERLVVDEGVPLGFGGGPEGLRAGY